MSRVIVIVFVLGGVMIATKGLMDELDNLVNLRPNIEKILEE